MNYPLNPSMSFDNDQEIHFNFVRQMKSGLALLEGGPGCGKTFTTSNIQLSLMDEGRQILAIYPTHYARLVGIGELIDNSRDEEGRPGARVLEYDGEEMPNENADVVLHYGEGDIRFRTIQAALGVKMIREPGREERFGQSFSDLIKAQMNFHYDCIFLDEISMVSEEMISAEPEGVKDKRDIKAGINFMLESLQKKFPDFDPLIHITGDFDQLRPIKGKLSDRLVREGIEFDIVTQLKKNHRSGREGIVALIQHILKHGKLPGQMNDYPGVYHLTDPKRYYDKFLQAVEQKGGKVLGLSYTNKVRMTHSNLAAQAKKQRSQFFIDNVLSVAEGKGVKLFPEPKTGPKTVIYFYNSEKTRILETRGEVTVPGTEWAGEFSIPAHQCVLERLMTREQYPGTFGAGPQFYLLDYLGSKNESDPKYRYLNHVKKTLNNSLKPLASGAWDVKGMRDPADLIDYLSTKDIWLGRMVEHLCYVLDKEHVVERYLWEGNTEREWTVMFDRVPAGTPCSLFNLLWANIYEEVNFKVLTTRSENALTCHSAQGSGRECVFLHARDIMVAPDPDTVKRLLYVGVSRSKEEITILT